MNKFALWVHKNHIKQRGLAKELGVSTSTIHEILREGKIPTMKLAMAIERYTQGIVTLYDWFDDSSMEDSFGFLGISAFPEDRIGAESGKTIPKTNKKTQTKKIPSIPRTKKRNSGIVR
jgi:DNA-binding XRE family transcriptional regulator